MRDDKYLDGADKNLVHRLDYFHPKRTVPKYAHGPTTTTRVTVPDEMVSAVMTLMWIAIAMNTFAFGKSQKHYDKQKICIPCLPFHSMRSDSNAL